MQPPFFYDYGTSIELGERVFFNFNCVVLDVGRVRIGSFTWPCSTDLHPHASVQCGVAAQPGIREAHRYRIRRLGRRRRDYSPRRSIGSKSVIGAGSVVTRDIPDHVFAAGNPCRVIREITE